MRPASHRVSVSPPYRGETVRLPVLMGLVMTPEMPHVLYRIRDATGALLYVGITMNIAARLEAHRAGKAWFGDVAKIDVETFPSRLEALTAERVAIQTEDPIHNVQHAVHRGSVKSRRATVPEPAFLVRCHGCENRPATSISVYLDAVFEYPSAMAAYEDALCVKNGDCHGLALWSSSDLHNQPDLPIWQPFCDACHPGGRRYDMAVKGGHVSYLDLLKWSAHLAEKDWFHNTDWSQLVYSLMGDNP